MLDTSIAFLWPDGGANATILEEDVTLAPTLAASYRVDEAADGYYCVAALTDAQVQGVFRAIGRPELCSDPRFATLDVRMYHLDELRNLIGGPDPRTRDEVMAALEAEDVPCGPVYGSVGEVPDDPQVRANRTFVESVHPRIGRMREPRPPVAFERTPAEIRRPAPAHGEHTDEVLRELGLAAAEIEDLRREGVVG
jgi:crotonobetainyl-CoA:carnitine CoA-transferase CaiB-like acyl-CoA transferase